MKIVDNPNAKFELWARDPRVFPLPTATGIPKFRSKRFRSYDEMNAWKHALLTEIAARGGVRWTK